MPYGTVQHLITPTPTVITTDNGNVIRTQSMGNWEIDENYSRTGSKNNTMRTVSEFPTGYTFKEQPVLLHKGPRLPYKVWNEKLKRYIWARKKILVYKRVKVYGPKPKKGMDLIPNSLNFTYSKIKYSGVNAASGMHPVTKRTIGYHGAIWSNFKLAFGSGYMASSPAAYIGPISSHFSSYVTKATSESTQKYYEKVKNQKVNLLQAMAERAQTAKMFSDLVLRLAKAISAAKKGNLQSAAGILFPKNTKDLANDVLLVNFGIKPLLSDIDGAANHIACEEKAVWDVIVKRRLNVPVTVLYDVTENSYVKCRTRVISHGHVEVTYKARLQMSLPAIRDLSRLGLINLPTIGWELMPWSFLIDYVIGIGDYINSLDSFLGISIQSQTKTVFQKEYISFIRDFGGVDKLGYFWSYGSSIVEAEKVKCVREILSNSPPKLPTPSLKDQDSLTHVINCAALLKILLSK